MTGVFDSQWRITHLGVVRLDFGDYMASEVKMPWQASGETAAVARAANAVQKTYGNAVNEIEFDRLRPFTTAAAARDAMMAHNAALSGDVGDAVIESLSGATFTLRGARFARVNPRIEDGSRFVCDYTLIGGKLDGATESTSDLGDTAPLDMALAGDTSGL